MLIVGNSAAERLLLGTAELRLLLETAELRLLLGTAAGNFDLGETLLAADLGLVESFENYRWDKDWQQFGTLTMIYLRFEKIVCYEPVV